MPSSLRRKQERKQKQEDGSGGLATQKYQRALQRIDFSGPLPPPNFLEKYNTIVPGAAERILEMAEAEQNHRHFLEYSIVRHETWLNWGGLSSALLIAIVAIGAGTLLGIHGNEFAGGALGASGLALIVIRFLFRPSK